LVIDTETDEKFYIKNPVMEKIQQEHINLKDLPEGNRGFGTGRIVPPLLAEAGVDVLVSNEFGEGMIRNLQAEGISYYITDKKDINEILNDIKEKNMQIAAREFENDNEFAREFGRGRGLGYGRGAGLGRGYGFGRKGAAKGFGRGRGYGVGGGFGFKRGWGN
jgi:predicted Fe-Mo cluster-binding NifX family protein